jgi:hypothetical protein
MLGRGKIDGLEGAQSKGLRVILNRLAQVFDHHAYLCGWWEDHLSFCISHLSPPFVKRVMLDFHDGQLRTGSQ